MDRFDWFAFGQLPEVIGRRGAGPAPAYGENESNELEIKERGCAHGQLRITSPSGTKTNLLPMQRIQVPTRSGFKGWNRA